MPQTARQRAQRHELFDAQDFAARLAAARSPIPIFKEAIREARTLLDQRYRNKGRIEAVIQDLAWFIDQILICAWQRHGLDQAGDTCLLAVGGYGRGELHPYSDIDIQILLGQDCEDPQKVAIERFLTFLWDINLDVGQSVRSIPENRDEALRDITVTTALMESRVIFGKPELHRRLMEEVDQTRIWKPEDFFAAKKAEQIARHRKHDDIEYALEPNIKVAPGGLRDIQTIGWIAKRYFAAPNFLALVERGFLQKSEYNDLIRGRDFLWKLRYGLHMLNGRREDRLLFEHQRSLAAILGYKDDRKSLGIEKLMQQYYRTVSTLRELNDVLLQLFDEEIIRSREQVTIRPINSRFQIRNNYIEAVHTRVFRQSPCALLEIFVLLAQDREIEGIRASTIRLIRNSRQLIDDKFRNDIRNKTLFMELLRSPHRVVYRLRQMKRYGILGAYLPEFGRIIGQTQHDLFHIYTVDDHTLQVMENMRRLRHPEAEEKFPVAAQVVKRLPKIELLYIAGLYHDIAKGRGGDHSELGAHDADAFCRRHYLGNWDSNLVSWLVENHLIMSSTAQREDIQDPEIIKDFALKVGDQVHLDYLYTLTICDINATNPNLWNSWRAALLRQLYLATKRALSQGLEEVVDKADWIRDNQLKAIAILQEKGFTEEQARALWHNPGDDYFLRETAEDIAWHTEAMAAYKPGDGPLILVKNSTEHRFEGATQVFIFARDSRFLFANIATAFDRLNLNIHDARIFHTDNRHTLLSFMVLEVDGTPISAPGRIEEMREKLCRYVRAQELQLENPNRARTPRKLRHFTRNTETTLTNSEGTPYSILEVLCPDRPGLLAKVATLFVEMNITLHNAKITTLGENVEDVFFITDECNRPLRDLETIETLQSSIRRTLDAECQPMKASA